MRARNSLYWLRNNSIRVVSRTLSILTRRIIPAESKDEWQHATVSFSQLGEDLAIQKVLTKIHVRSPAWYVDIGAFDPIQFSNTLLLHKRGWCGVNVDADPTAIERFKSARPLDVNIHAAVSDAEEDVGFFMYRSPATHKI